MRLGALGRQVVQDLVESWRADGLSASTVQNTLNPLQALARRAVRSGELAVDPTDGLELPSIRGRRDRIASPAEAAALIKALPESERALWATALYAGLRRGELRALRWEDIDFEAAVINVRRSWDADPAIGEIEVKSDAGRRRVPLIGALRKIIVEHKLATGRDGVALVFGRTAEQPFIPSTVRKRALAAWTSASRPVHKCRGGEQDFCLRRDASVTAPSSSRGSGRVDQGPGRGSFRLAKRASDAGSVGEPVSRLAAIRCARERSG
jgi:integrase